MTKTLQFHIEELTPYINWVYFYHAWGVKAELAHELRQEADTVLAHWSKERRQIRFRIRLFKAHSMNEDILLYGDKGGEDKYILPLLRQQRSPFLCLSDFLPPVSMKAETIGPEGAIVANITLFAVLIYEIFGPLFTRMALTAAGDIQPIPHEVKHRRRIKLEEINKK